MRASGEGIKGKAVKTGKWPLEFIFVWGNFFFFNSYKIVGNNP